MSSRMHGEPFISTRKSIAWIPSTPPFEDSDVLVLSSRSTSPGGDIGATLFYLDLRLSLPLGTASKVNWGFAGLRHTLSTSPPRFRWVHNTIDSRSDGMVDEGEVIQRDGVEIETGTGLNPITGQREVYEEIWRDEPLPAGSPYIFVSSSPSIEDSTATMAILGPHALALAQEPEFQAVRMHRRTSAVPEVAWETVFSNGTSAQVQDLNELIGIVDRVCQYVRGGSIRLGNRSWTIWDAGRVGTAGNS